MEWLSGLGFVCVITGFLIWIFARHEGRIDAEKDYLKDKLDKENKVHELYRNAENNRPADVAAAIKRLRDAGLVDK